MQKNQEVYNLIILDESGSMVPIKDFIINGFNELIQTIQHIAVQFPEQDHYLTLVSFNGSGIKTLISNEKVTENTKINTHKYLPNYSTPLFDAMGISFQYLKSRLIDKNNYNVLVSVFTDGEENASREFSGNQIKSLVGELKKENWTFTYIGTDHDVEGFAKSVDINNVMSYEKSDHGLADYFEKEKAARMHFSRKIRNNESTDSDYFENNGTKSSKRQTGGIISKLFALWQNR